MPMMSPGKASSASSRLCAKKKIGLGTAIGLPVCTWVSFMPRLNLPEHSRMKATRSRCCGFMFACTLKMRSEEHTSELQSLMRISYAVFCLKKHTTDYLHNICLIFLFHLHDFLIVVSICTILVCLIRRN